MLMCQSTHITSHGWTRHRHILHGVCGLHCILHRDCYYSQLSYLTQSVYLLLNDFCLSTIFTSFAFFISVTLSFRLGWKLLRSLIHDVPNVHFTILVHCEPHTRELQIIDLLCHCVVILWKRLFKSELILHIPE